MNISTQLTHLDDRLAVCMATLQDGDKRISVYASALATESGVYPDLAQKRAVELGLSLHEKGVEVFQDLKFSVQPLPLSVGIPVASLIVEQELAHPELVAIDEEPTSTNIIPEDVESAPW